MSNKTNETTTATNANILWIVTRRTITVCESGQEAQRTRVLLDNEQTLLISITNPVTVWWAIRSGYDDNAFIK